MAHSLERRVNLNGYGTQDANLNVDLKIIIQELWHHCFTTILPVCFFFFNVLLG